MFRFLLAVSLGCLCLAGCSHASSASDASSSSAKAKDAEPTDPMDAARSGMHAGAFQLSNAADDLHTALTMAKSLEGTTKNADLKAALADVIQQLDDAGASVADFTEEPPELAEFKKDFASEDKKRLDAIDGANDALHDVSDSAGAVDDFGDGLSQADSKQLDALEDALDSANDDLAEAIKALGGKIEPDDTQTVPDSGSQAAGKSAAKADL